MFSEPTLPLIVREVIREAGASLLPQIGRTPEPKHRRAFIVSGEQTAALGAERGNAIWSMGFSPNGEILAGGQSLVPYLAFRMRRCENLIDLNGVSELAGIREVSGRLEIGAMTRQRAIAGSQRGRSRS